MLRTCGLLTEQDIIGIFPTCPQFSVFGDCSQRERCARRDTKSVGKSSLCIRSATCTHCAQHRSTSSSMRSRITHTQLRRGRTSIQRAASSLLCTPSPSLWTSSVSNGRKPSTSCSTHPVSHREHKSHGRLTHQALSAVRVSCALQPPPNIDPMSTRRG